MDICKADKNDLNNICSCSKCATSWGIMEDSDDERYENLNNITTDNLYKKMMKERENFNISIPKPTIMNLESSKTKKSLTESEIKNKFEELQETVQPNMSVSWEHEVYSNIPITEEDLQKKLDEQKNLIAPYTKIQPEITPFLILYSDHGNLILKNSKGEAIRNNTFFKIIREDIVSETNNIGCIFYFTKPDVEFKTYTPNIPFSMETSENIMKTYHCVKEYIFEGKTFHVELPNKRVEGAIYK